MKRILAASAAVLVLATAPLSALAASVPMDSQADAAPAGIWAQPEGSAFADVIAGEGVLASPNPDRFSGDVVAEPDTAAPAERRYLTFGGTSRLPEPAAWAMMMIGFGLAGAILRRRNRDRGLGQAIAKPIAPGLEA